MQVGVFVFFLWFGRFFSSMDLSLQFQSAYFNNMS